MAQQKKGFITRLLEGKERSEEYARSTLPTNRWQLFWDIFKGNFWKLVKVNLLTLIFFIPLLAVIGFQYMFNKSIGNSYPFGASIGVGYPAEPSMNGVFESMSIMNDLMFGGGMLIASILAAVGLAGGMYVVRNMVWTEGIFVGNDFWRGVKLNFKNALQAVLLFGVVYVFSQTVLNMSGFMLVYNEDMSKFQEIMLKISQVTSYLLIVLALMISFWMLALGVNYKMGFFTLVKNGFLVAVGTLPQTVFFGTLALVPLLLVWIGSVTMPLILIAGIMLFLMVGIAYSLLVWLDFAQWVFDKYINPKIEGAKVGRGIYSKDGSAPLTGDDSAASVEYQRMLLSHGRSKLVAKPIKPIDDSLQIYDLPTSFTREDLKRLRESKQNIAEDTEAYAEEHKNDLRYVEYNRQFDEREKALQEEDAKKGKKKRGKKLKASKTPDRQDE